jgi:hypothetical protein
MCLHRHVIKFPKHVIFTLRFVRSGCRKASQLLSKLHSWNVSFEEHPMEICHGRETRITMLWWKCEGTAVYFHHHHAVTRVHREVGLA